MTCVYYIDYRERREQNWYKKLFDKVFFRYEITDFDKSKKLISVNKSYISRRSQKKLSKLFCTDNRYDNYDVLISKSIETADNIQKTNSFQEKVIMRSMVVNLIDYMEKIIGTDFCNENVYVSICSDKNIEMILDIARKFKCMNIVTNKIKKLKRLDNKLSNYDEIIFSISNNRRKALKNAKVFINIDFDKELMEEFNINRNCIIINLNTDKLKLKNSFHGSIIDSIEINYKNRYEKYIDINNFNKSMLYESYISGAKYNEAKSYIESDMCKIEKLIGNYGEICGDELRNNFRKSIIKLDKYQKKD